MHRWLLDTQNGAGLTAGHYHTWAEGKSSIVGDTSTARLYLRKTNLQNFKTNKILLWYQMICCFSSKHTQKHKLFWFSYNSFLPFIFSIKISKDSSIKRSKPTSSELNHNITKFEAKKRYKKYGKRQGTRLCTTIPWTFENDVIE